MSSQKSGILGTGKYLPQKTLTNKDLEKMVDTNDKWITTRTGIRERRIAGNSEATSDMAVKAGKKAIENAGLTPENIDMIIVSTITPDMFFPSTACVVQNELGINGIPAFDISVACSGFLYNLAIADQFIQSGAYKNILCIAAEKMSSITDWSDRNTCVLMGDGAGAAVLGRVGTGGILSVYLGAAGEHGDLLKVPAGGSRNPATHDTVENRQHFLKMQGNELFRHAVRLMAESALKSAQPLNLTGDDIDLVIPHQANIRILHSVAKHMGINPEEKLYLNIHKYGNMSAASTAVALAEAVEEGRIKSNDKILLVAFGAGLTYGGIIIEM